MAWPWDAEPSVEQRLPGRHLRRRRLDAARRLADRQHRPRDHRSAPPTACGSSASATSSRIAPRTARVRPAARRRRPSSCGSSTPSTRRSGASARSRAARSSSPGGCASRRSSRSASRSRCTTSRPAPATSSPTASSATTASRGRRTSTWTSTRGGTSSARSWSRSTCPRCCGRSSRRPSWKGETRRARHEHRPVPVGRGPLQAHARDLGGVPGLPQPVLDPDQVAAAAARPGPAEGDRRGHGRQRVPVGADAGREGLARDRAAHAAPTRAAGGRRRAQPQRHPDRRADRAADARASTTHPSRSSGSSRSPPRPSATYIGGQTLFLRGPVRDIFFDWLREHRPDLRRALRAPVREGRLPLTGRAPQDRGRRRRAVAAPHDDRDPYRDRTAAAAARRARRRRPAPAGDRPAGRLF